MQNKRSQLPI